MWSVFSFTPLRRLTRAQDLGGQRSERAKWEKEMRHAKCLLFVSSLTEWDQKCALPLYAARSRLRLREDFTQSRMVDTLDLWKEVMEMPTVQRRTVVVLLNKLDLFKAKMASNKKKNFQKFFTEYNGTNMHVTLAHMR